MNHKRKVSRPCHAYQQCLPVISELGVATWFLPSRGVAGLQWARAAGARCVHFDVHDIEGDPGLFASCAEDLGIKLQGLALVDIEDAGLSDTWRTREIVAESVRLIRSLSVPLAYIPAFGNALIGSPEDELALRDLTRFAIGEVGDDATVAIEAPLSADQLQSLFKAIGDAPVQLILDTQNPLLWGHDGAMIAEAFASRTAAVHVKDGIVSMGDCPIGHGEAPIAAMLSRLANAGVRPPFVLENDYRKANPRDLVADAMALESMWSAALARAR